MVTMFTIQLNLAKVFGDKNVSTQFSTDSLTAPGARNIVDSSVMEGIVASQLPVNNLNSLAIANISVDLAVLNPQPFLTPYHQRD
jgi:hypothetical protein